MEQSKMTVTPLPLDNICLFLLFLALFYRQEDSFSKKGLLVFSIYSFTYLLLMLCNFSNLCRPRFFSAYSQQIDSQTNLLRFSSC